MLLGGIASWLLFDMTTEVLHAVNSSINVTREDEISSSSLDIVQGFLGGIAVLASLGNGLVCLVILRNRHILRFPYNKFLFSLAITDMLTGKEESHINEIINFNFFF